MWTKAKMTAFAIGRRKESAWSTRFLSRRKTATFLAALGKDRIDPPCLFGGPINGEGLPAAMSSGSSGALYPAAGFVAEARAHGLRTCEINLEAADSAWERRAMRFPPRKKNS